MNYDEVIEKLEAMYEEYLESIQLLSGGEYADPTDYGYIAGIERTIDLVREMRDANG